MNIHGYTIAIKSLCRQMEADVKAHIAKLAVKVLYLTPENQVSIPSSKDSLVQITHVVIDEDGRLAYYDDEEYGVGHSELSAGQEVDLLLSCVEQIDNQAKILGMRLNKKKAP